LNGNPIVVDLDLHALGLLPVLIDLIAQDHDRYPENPADEVEQVTTHRIVNA
jgi:hypothetical protein